MARFLRANPATRGDIQKCELSRGKRWNTIFGRRVFSG